MFVGAIYEATELLSEQTEHDIGLREGTLKRILISAAALTLIIASHQSTVAQDISPSIIAFFSPQDVGLGARTTSAFRLLSRPSRL
jgi:hypothetical protein